MSTYVNIPDAGAAGDVTVASPISGDGTGGNPVTIADGAIVIAKLDSLVPDQMASLQSVLANPIPRWFVSAEIDLTTTGIYTVIAAMAYRIRVISQFWEIRTKSGTISTSPTFSDGTNAATYDNICASQTQAGFTTQAVETSVGPSNVSPAPFGDLTASGFRVNVTIGATGVAPVLTAKLGVLALFLPV